MAADARFQGQGIGTALMQRVVFPEAIELSRRLGCVGVYVDAKSNAVRFYTRVGLVPLQVEGDAVGAPTAMFIPLKSIPAG